MADTDPADQLKKLADLRAQGMLSEAEFNAAKAKVLAGTPAAGTGPTTSKKKKKQKGGCGGCLAVIVGVVVLVVIIGALSGSGTSSVRTGRQAVNAASNWATNYTGSNLALMNETNALQLNYQSIHTTCYKNLSGTRAAYNCTSIGVPEKLSGPVGVCEEVYRNGNVTGYVDNGNGCTR